MTDQINLEDKIREILDGEGSATDKIQAIYDDRLPPVLPDPLFGARATHPTRGEGIVVSHFPDWAGEVRFMFPDEAISDGTQCVWMNPGALTFHTPDTPDHPEYLETEEDYHNAPEGTIVVGGNAMPTVLINGGWGDIHSEKSDHDVMAGIRRRVLRWGWGA